MLSVAAPILGAEEKAALSDVVDSGWITMGDRVRAFEQTFAGHHGAEDAVAVNSCTAGLHLIMLALGIGPRDEVLVPSLTFVATINCVLYAGATPVFVDIDSFDRPLISIADAADKCTANTKAVIVMHYAGYLVDRREWRRFASSRGLFLIEDAAHAAGAEQAGTLGDAAAFSFYGNKNMTTAEGGMVTARDAGVLERIRQMRGHGLTSGTFQRFTSQTVGYDVTMLGYNYRMDELRAAVGLAQMKKLSGWNEKRRALTCLYMKRLKELCPGLTLPFTDGEGSSVRPSSYHIMPIVLPEEVDRGVVIRRLKELGIQTSNHYPAAHLLSFYRKHVASVCLSQTEEFARRELTLPLHPRMDELQVECVANAVAKALCR